METKRGGGEGCPMGKENDDDLSLRGRGREGEVSEAKEDGAGIA